MGIEPITLALLIDCSTGSYYRLKANKENHETWCAHLHGVGAVPGTHTFSGPEVLIADEVMKRTSSGSGVVNADKWSGKRRDVEENTQ